MGEAECPLNIWLGHITFFKSLVLCTGDPPLQNASNAVALGDNIYEQIDQKPNYEEVELSTNTAYGMVRR